VPKLDRKSIPEIKRENRKQTIINAYRAYTAKEPNSLDDLLGVVREFAFHKFLEIERKSRETAETADDWAQEVIIAVWQGLDKFEGSPEAFYSWIAKIAYNEKIDAANYLKEDKQTMVPLMVPMLDDDGNETDELTDNPAIYERSTGVEHVCIPDSVTGIDYNICLSLMVGVHHERPDGTWGERAKTYAEVAKELSMTEAEVKQRLYRLRERLNAEKAEEKRGNFERWERAINWESAR
jgi:DNA-directed RNA polymerase specialized sigma24 family protein